MEIFIEKENKTLNRDFRGRVNDLLELLGINPITVIVVKNNELQTEDDLLETKDEIKILSVVSGG